MRPSKVVVVPEIFISWYAISKTNIACGKPAHKANIIQN